MYTNHKAHAFQKRASDCPYSVIARLPINYADMGAIALTDAGKEALDQMIADALPAWAYWCGDEILAPIGQDTAGFDLLTIHDAAVDRLFDMEEYNGLPVWET